MEEELLTPPLLSQGAVPVGHTGRALCGAGRVPPQPQDHAGECWAYVALFEIDGLVWIYILYNFAVAINFVVLQYKSCAGNCNIVCCIVVVPCRHTAC